MLAFLLGLATAVCKTGKNIFTKYATAHASDGFIGWGVRLTTFLWLTPLLLITATDIPLTARFLTALVGAVGILGAGSILTARSLRLADLSLVAPIYAFTPLLTVLSAYLIIDEEPTLPAFLGIALIAAGTYLLNIQRMEKGMLEPIRALTTNKGVQMAGIVVILGSLLPPLDKIGITATTPLFWPLLTHCLITIVFLPIALRRGARSTADYRRVFPLLAAVGLANALLWIAQAHAYTLTNVSYITALKRVSILLSVLSGHVLFNEEFALTRLPAALCIMVGVLLIALGGL